MQTFYQKRLQIGIERWGVILTGAVFQADGGIGRVDGRVQTDPKNQTSDTPLAPVHLQCR